MKTSRQYLEMAANLLEVDDNFSQAERIRVAKASAFIQMATALQMSDGDLAAVCGRFEKWVRVFPNARRDGIALGTQFISDVDIQSETMDLIKVVRRAGWMVDCVAGYLEPFERCGHVRDAHGFCCRCGVDWRRCEP